MKKFLIACCLAVFFSTTSVVFADDIFTPVAESLAEIDNLILSCNQNGLPCDLQKANAEIIRDYIEIGREDIELNSARAEYSADKLSDLASKTKAELENIITNNSGEAIPSYTGTKIVSDKLNFKTAGNTMFFSGHLVFEPHIASDMKRIGSNIYAWEMGPRDTIVQEGTFLPSWSLEKTGDSEAVSVETDRTQAYTGETSLKLSCSTPLANGNKATVSQDIYVKPNKTYVVKLYLKGMETRGNTLMLGDTQKTLPNGTFDWQPKTYEVTTGENQQKLEFKIITQSLTTALWVDNISVTEKGREYNQINNGDFETVTWPDGGFLENQGVMGYIKAVMEEAKDDGISVMLLMSPHYIPDWFWENYPDAYCYQEGFLKGDVTNNTYKEFIKTHVQALAKAADFTNLHSLILSNEPIYNTQYYTNGKQIFKDKFIEYLKNKYNSSSDVYIPYQMRKNWGITESNYKWSSVTLSTGTSANTIAATGKFWDWMEFNNKIFTDFHKWIADMVHEVDKDIPVHTKINSTVFNREKLNKGIDTEEMYSYLDYNGFDGGMNFESERKGYLYIRMAEDFANSISEKPIVNSENHILPDGCTDYSDKHALIAGADLWQGFIHGRTASAAWVWRKSSASPYNNSITYRPDVIAATVEKTMQANKNAASLEKLQNADRIFYILYSDAAILYSGDAYLNSCYNAYEALWRTGQRASFITEKQIADGKLSNDKILVIPSTANINEIAVEKLNSFTGRSVVVGDIPNKNEYNLAVNLNLKNFVKASDDVNGISSIFETILAEKNIPEITLRDSDGNLLDMTDIRTVTDENGILINACNNTWTEKENISVYYAGKKLNKLKDELNNCSISSEFNLSPFVPVLLRIDKNNMSLPTTSQDIYGWIEEPPYKDEENDIYDTVNIVEDATYGKALEFIKQSEKNDTDARKRLAVFQNVSPSKLIDGHTYTLEFAYNVPETTDKFWISAGFSTHDNNKRTQPISIDHQGKGWEKGDISIVYNETNFSNSGNLGRIIPVYLLVQEPARFKIADVKLYDNADENKTNLLVNGDFSDTADSHKNSYSYGWDVFNSKKMFDETTGEVFDEVSFVAEDDTYSNIIRINKKSEKISNSFFGIEQTIPQEKLISGHTYVFECDMKLADSSSGTVRVSPLNQERNGSNCVGWHHYSTWEYTYTSGDMWTAFRCIDIPTDLYLANISVYDKADANKTNLLVNGDFSYREEDNSECLYNWITVDNGHEEDSVSVVDNIVYGKALLIDKQSSSDRKQVGVYAQIPQNKLVSGHTYTIEYMAKMEPKYQHYGKTGWWAKDSFSELYGNNVTSWRKYTNDITYTSGVLEPVFLVNGLAGRMWIADVKVYDTADADKTNILVNGDFYGLQTLEIKFFLNGDRIQAEFPGNSAYKDIMIAYAVYRGNVLEEVHLTKKTLQQSDKAQKIYVYPKICDDGYTEKAFLWELNTMEPLSEPIIIK